MLDSERKSLSNLELVRIRQENYDEELVPEALNMIRAVAHSDSDIHLALEGLNDEQREALKKAETIEAFRDAILDAFSDKSAYVIAGSLGILDASVAVMNGRPGDTLEEIFDGNEDIVSRVKEVKSVAREILRQLRSDLLTPQGQPALATAR